MKAGDVYGATKDGKAVGFKVVEVMKSGQWQPYNKPYDETVTMAVVVRVKEPGVERVVKYYTAEGKPRGWTLIEAAHAV